jgi:hypothetical protein
MKPRSYLLSIAAAFCISASASARADAIDPATFSTVDGYRGDGDTMHVTGIIAGTNTTKTADFWFANLNGGLHTISYQTCERAILTMLNRPGRFTLNITSRAANTYECTLTRN